VTAYAVGQGRKVYHRVHDCADGVYVGALQRALAETAKAFECATWNEDQRQRTPYTMKAHWVCSLGYPGLRPA